MRVIRFIFNILLFIYNKYKAYYKYHKIEGEKYNTYSESTQLSASVLDINISVKIFNECFKYISKWNIPSLNDINLSDYISRLSSLSLTNDFNFNICTSGFKGGILIKSKLLQPIVHSSDSGFSLHNHLHNFHSIPVINPSSFNFKLMVGFLILCLLCLIFYIFEKLLSYLFKICIKKFKLYIKSLADNAGYSSSYAEASSSNAQGYSNYSGTQYYTGNNSNYGMASSGSGGNDPNENKKNDDSKKNRYHYRDFKPQVERIYDEFQNLRLTREEINYIISTLQVIRGRLAWVDAYGNRVVDFDLPSIEFLASCAYDDLRFLVDKGMFYNRKQYNIPYKNPRDERYFAGVYLDFRVLLNRLFEPLLRGAVKSKEPLTIYKDNGNVMMFRKREILKTGALRKHACPMIMVFLGDSRRTIEVVDRVIIGLTDYVNQLSSDVMPYSGEPMDLDGDPMDLDDPTG